MAISIDKHFEVRAPAPRVWSFLTDLEQVSSCLKGSKITGTTGEGRYTGTMNVKLGPVSSTYRGTVRFDRLDEAAGIAELTASGKDTRGKGSADMTMRSEVEEADGITRVTVSSTVRVTGILAQLGRGMIVDVSDQLFGQFTDCMRGKLEVGDQVGEPSDETGPASRVTSEEASRTSRVGTDESLDLTSMGTGAAGRAVVRTLARPAAWLVMATVLVLLWIVLT